MKVDFSVVVLETIDGEQLELRGHKVLANALYGFTRNLDLLEIAREMNKGNVVDLREGDITEVKRVINDERVGMRAFVRKALLDHLKNGKFEKCE